MVIISNGSVTKYKKSNKIQIPMTWKRWKKLPEFDKELLQEKHDVILVDRVTLKEKLKGTLTWENYKKFWMYYDKGWKTFDQIMKEFDKGMKSSGLGGNSKSMLDTLGFQTRKVKPKKTSKKKKGKKRESSNADKIWGKPSKVRI